MLSKPEENLIKIYEKSFRENWALEAVTDYGTTNTLTYARRASYRHLRCRPVASTRRPLNYKFTPR